MEGISNSERGNSLLTDVKKNNINDICSLTYCYVLVLSELFVNKIKKGATQCLDKLS